MGKIPDISFWQGAVKWTKSTKAETDYIILRSSCGTAKDQRFSAYVAGAIGQGIPYGVYHYAMFTTLDRARAEADVFYKSVIGSAKKLPSAWFLDVEDGPLLYANGKSLPMNPNFFALVNAFYVRLRKLLGPSAWIGYYGGASVYEPYGGLSKIGWDILWIPNYGKNTGVVCSKPGMACDLHQYTSVASWNGKNPIDMSRLCGGMSLSMLQMGCTSPGTVSLPAMPDDPTATEAEEESGPKKQAVDLNSDGLIVRVTEPQAWFVRTGDGTDYAKLTENGKDMLAYQGYEYEYVATSQVTGWLCIRMMDGRMGWISSKGAKVIDLNKREVEIVGGK